MGGLALKNTFTRRYQAEEYFSLTREVNSLLVQIYEIDRIEVIPAFHEKESFGDMDVLYNTTHNSAVTIDTIKKVFQPNEIVRNGEVISFDYKELQIDIIHSPYDSFDYALHYFSWNDTGNLVGKLAHQMGLKHGHRGLVLPLRDGDNKFADVTITLDPEKTLIFLGLDHDKFRDGFRNLQEIFEFVTASPYYNPENYKLENLNTIARVRDRKRETYRKFLEYGETWTGTPFPKVEDKSVFLQKIFEFFPEAYPEYKDAMQKLAMQKFVKEKFNGNIVSDYTGLNDKQLGAFMQELKKDWYFSNENIVYLTDKQLWDRVMEKFDDLCVMNRNISK